MLCDALNNITSCAQRINFRLDNTWPYKICGTLGRPASRLTNIRTPEWAMQPLWLLLLDRRAHCGFCFWIEERIVGSFWRPHYSKCCASGKNLLPPIHTSPKYMAMLQDRQNAKLRKHLHLYNAAFTFMSTRVQSVGFKLGLGVIPTKCKEDFTTWLVVWNP